MLNYALWLIQVCGSDGLTYTNECKLKMASCEQRSDITRQYFGACGKPKTILWFINNILTILKYL